MMLTDKTKTGWGPRCSLPMLSCMGKFAQKMSPLLGVSFAGAGVLTQIVPALRLRHPTLQPMVPHIEHPDPCEDRAMPSRKNRP